MRILMLGAASSVHVVRWANAFVQRDHEVHLASQHLPAAGLAPEVIMHRLPHLNGVGYILNRSALKKLAARLSPDVVNAHYATGYGTLVRAVDRVPVVLNVWGSDVFDFPERSGIHRQWLRRNLRHADHVVSTSAVMAKRAVLIGGPDLQITVVPFGVDTAKFHPREPVHSDQKELLIGTVKALEPIYGIDLLIRAFALVIPKLPQAKMRLMIVGEGSERARLLKLIQELDLVGSVDLIGAVPHDRIPDVLRTFDLFCALSRAESFGVAVLEASACGLPVIVSNVGGLPEIVQQNVSGLIVPPEDPEAAAFAIIELLIAPQKREEFGIAGRHLVEEKFQWNGCVDRMLAVLSKAAVSGRK